MNLVSSLLLTLLAANVAAEVPIYTNAEVVRLVNRQQKRLEFEVYYPGWAIIKNIVLSERSGVDGWLLRLNKSEGLFAEEASGAHVYCNKCLSLDGYINIIEGVFGEIVSDPRIEVRGIKMDIDLVFPIWSDSVRAIKDQIPELAGSVSQKEYEVTSALRSVISNTELVARTCDVIKKYGYACSNPIIGMNPVFFKEEYIGGSWSVLKGLEDAGLHEEMSFFIRIEKA